MRLGTKQSLAWWDIATPVRRVKRRYTYAEAKDFVLTQLYSF
jgi:oligoendopeptidase F